MQGRKTRFWTASQRQCVSGLVVNAHPNVSRPTYDRLRAILHNCARHGPASQTEGSVADFGAHLRGAIEWCAVNPSRARRLRAMYEAVDWSTPASVSEHETQ